MRRPEVVTLVMNWGGGGSTQTLEGKNTAEWRLKKGRVSIHHVTDIHYPRHSCLPPRLLKIYCPLDRLLDGRYA